MRIDGERRRLTALTPIIIKSAFDNRSVNIHYIQMIAAQPILYTARLKLLDTATDNLSLAPHCRSAS